MRENLKIITWNMAYGPPRFGSTGHEAWDYIKRNEPDFALLQETKPEKDFDGKYDINFQ
ncbi:MAG: endonuclease/exonuclease/phosphatase family protein [Spirochaetaceae bacterium]|jgi:exonuclease III|nr:endonuclease/exonuclease/phosphatase family protein [Spirochaetaceae bacterium]